MTNDGETYRLEVIRQLEAEYAQFKAKARQIKADIKTQDVKLHGQLLRAKAPHHDPALCFECKVFHDETVKMVRQSSSEYGVDLFRCANGHERRDSRK
jgi:hypothetical protein